MKKKSKITISRNKASSEIIIASHIILADSSEAKLILEGIKETISASDFTPTENFNYFMGIYMKLIERKKSLFDNFSERRNDIIITEINDTFCAVNPSERAQSSFLDWMKKVEDKIVYVDIDFMNDEGDMAISEIVYYYYWNCYKDYVESIDSQDISYYDKLKIKSPCIIDNSEDKDIVSFSDMKEKKSDKSKYTFGISGLDEYINLQPGNLFYVGARPSVGKSMLVINAALLNALNGIPCFYISLEMSQEQTKDRMKSWIEAESQFREVDIEMINKNFFMLDAEEMSGDYIFSKIERFATKYRECMVFLDHIGKVRYNNMDEWGSLRLASRTSKDTALKTKCVFIACALASRESEFSGFTMSSLYGASTLEADADGIVGMESSKNTNSRGIEKLTLKIVKNRQGIKDVDCLTNVDRTTMHFEDSD